MGNAKPHTLSTGMNVVEALRNHPTAYIQFAAVNANIAGMAVCFKNYSTFGAAHFINIHDLAVLPDFRNNGVATALLHGVTLYAIENNCTRVTLEVRDDNSVARRLYAKMGFVSCTPSMEYLSRDITPYFKTAVHNVS